MKNKSYESRILITYIIIFISIVEVLLIYLLNKNRLYTYKNISCIATGKNTCMVVADSSSRNTIHKNSCFFLNNKKYKYKIENENKNIIHKDNKTYSEIVISFNNNLSTGDIENIVLKDKKIKLIEIFKIIWDGDNN